VGWAEQGDDNTCNFEAIEDAGTDPATLTVDYTAAGDPEGSLVGGKLLRGGLLLHGVLGR